MRLTIELILQAPQYKSPAQNWTLNLRGCQLDTIENLGATGDYFECIDISDNQIIKLEDFPPLPRLTSLIVCNNRVARIAPDLMSFLPNLESLVLTNNRIERLVDLMPLFEGEKELDIIN
ncbi:U2 small nuclear ribonucleoprotein, putative [Eimeria brunetti]|uniref:U2 small nuclear ribonucleoprotein, putative n=1 Tax=Eimeria brunetti TaxID=51314 RepID=U6LIG2_9EIME|nr:U2 small nuclear ribonucleoprotein, putative [Eimeria brunetti]